MENFRQKLEIHENHTEEDIAKLGEHLTDSQVANTFGWRLPLPSKLVRIATTRSFSSSQGAADARSRVVNGASGGQQ